MKTNFKIYLFGDSICFGQHVSLNNTWAHQLAIKLQELDLPDKNIIVQNPSINGNTTRQALERLQFSVTSQKPDIVVVQFGMNDCNFWDADNGEPRVSKNSFNSNLEEILEKILAAGTSKCILNTNHPSNKGMILNNKKNYDLFNLEYNNEIRKIYNKFNSKGLNVYLCDNEKAWREFLISNPNILLDHLLLEDGIHLNEKGHDLYKNTLIPIIIKLIN